MRKIILELSPSSCQNAINELKDYNKKVRSACKEVCKRLAEIGAKEAQRVFAKGAQEGNGDTVVKIRSIPSGYAIVASGEDVYFVEFGTGIDATSTHGFNVSVPIYPGSYSENNAQQYSTVGYWWYRNTKYDGTPAYMPMYYAEKAIRANVNRVAREVLGKL